VKGNTSTKVAMVREKSGKTFFFLSSGKTFFFLSSGKTERKMIAPTQSSMSVEVWELHFWLATKV